MPELTTKRLATIIVEELNRRGWGDINMTWLEMVSQGYSPEDYGNDNAKAMEEVLESVVARLKEEHQPITDRSKQMTKCTDPSHQLLVTQGDLDRIERDKKRVEESGQSPKQWYEITVLNEPLLAGNLRIRAASKEEAKAIFSECLQRTCVVEEISAE